MNHFAGIWVPIVTPFDEEGIDHTALARIAQRLAASGIAGIVTGATTGEGHALRMPERIAVVGTLREALGQNYPIIIGVNSLDTQQAAQDAQQLAALSPQTLLVTPPPYVRPSQAGLIRHFEYIAQAAGLGVMAYNIPYRTGVTLELDTLQRLAASGSVVAIKECGSNPERMLRLIHETGLETLCGDDPHLLSALASGAHGAITASANLCPEHFVALYRAVKQNDLALAQRLAAALQPLIYALFAEPNPCLLKSALAQREELQNILRLPLLASGIAQGQGVLALLEQSFPTKAAA